LVQAAKLWGEYAAQAQAITLHIGTNDILQNAYPTAAVAAADMGPKLASLMEQIRVLAPHAQIFVASIISFGSSSTTFDKFNEQVSAYNAALPAIVAAFKAQGGLATFVDMAKESAGTCHASGSCCPAGVHPTVIGYKSMAEVWYKALVAAHAGKAGGPLH
jgi:lysophospholipase L1-like esterase